MLRVFGLWLFLLPMGLWANTQSTAFFYAHEPPVDALSQFDQLIVEAENITRLEQRDLQQHGTQLYAYVSIGEVGRYRSWYPQIKSEWKLGENSHWSSDVMDMSAVQWHDFLLSSVIKPLWKKGYRGFFLDTVDSFNIVSKDDMARNIQMNGIVSLIQKIKTRYPEVKLIANRGFEVIPKIAHHLDAVVAESLYRHWDNAKQRYSKAKPNDTQWLLNKLKSIQADHGLPIIVIDYVPPAETLKAASIAEKIKQNGFTPWIATPKLDTVGIGSRSIISCQVGQRLVKNKPSYRSAQKDAEHARFSCE